MTYPQGQMPAQFQQYQPPAAPQYAQPQVPQYPGYPQQAPMPPMPGYPQQNYGQAPVNQAPLPQGTLDDFYNQPSTGGGPGWKFQQIGQRHVGQVARPLHDGDVQPVTDFRSGAVVTYRDGRAKMQLIVPLIEPGGEAATWYVKGKDRDALAAAMAAAGAPAGPPEAGAWIMVTYVADKPSGQGLNPTKVKDVQYVRPGADAPAAPAPVAAPAAPVQQYQPTAAQFPQGVAAAPQQPVAPQGLTQPQMPGPIPPAGVGPTPMPTAPAPVPQAQPVAQASAPVSNAADLAAQLPPEQAALFAQMLQQQG
jgi:hypothetical protein